MDINAKPVSPGQGEDFVGVPPLELKTMATLADSFIADLDDLSDNEADHHEEDDLDAQNMEEDIVADIEALNYEDLDSVSKLQSTQRYTDIMQVIFLLNTRKWKMPFRRILIYQIREQYWKMILSIS